MNDIHNLNDRQYKALIGINKQDFNELTVVFSETELKINALHYAEFEAFYQRKPSSGGSPLFTMPSEKLFFTLFYLKNYPGFDVFGFIFGCSGKTAHTLLHKNLAVLEATLKTLNVLPVQKIESKEKFIDFIKEHKDIIIDATESIHHRKKDKKEQEKHFSGKKKLIH